MIEKLLDASIRFRWGVVILTLIVSAYGVFQLLKLPIDAVPDITNKQVQINTVAPNLGPLDMERLVTFPVETAMAGIPGLESSRSISRNGFSQVTVVFEDGTDVYFARQLVNERLQEVKGKLPPGLEKQLRRNGTLPPGLQKKATPLPADLERRLPALPSGHARVVVSDRVLVVEIRTQKIVDVLLVLSFP